jgi:hypothetical protein
MAKAKKTKAKKSKAKKTKAKKSAKRVAAAAPRKTKKSKAKRAAPKKKAARKAPAKAKAVKKPVKKSAPKKKAQPIGEGDYQASRSFLKDESKFVKRHAAEIPKMGKEAEAALDGPEGAELRAAEEQAKNHSKAPGSEA